MEDRVAWQSDKGVFLIVTVRPNSHEKNFVHHISDEEILINLESPATEGKANKELLKRLSKCLGMSTTDVILAAGGKSKRKTILLRKVTLDDVLIQLGKCRTAK